MDASMVSRGQLPSTGNVLGLRHSIDFRQGALAAAQTAAGRTRSEWSPFPGADSRATHGLGEVEGGWNVRQRAAQLRSPILRGAARPPRDRKARQSDWTPTRCRSSAVVVESRFEGCAGLSGGPAWRSRPSRNRKDSRGFWIGCGALTGLSSHGDGEPMCSGLAVPRYRSPKCLPNNQKKNIN